MNFVDTADVVFALGAGGHAGGESETIIGKLASARAEAPVGVVLATKVGKPHGRRRQGPVAGAYIRRAVEASLRRLQTDRIDLYQAHDDDAATPLEETLGAFAELIKEGKVRAIGASNYTAPRLALRARRRAQRLGLPRYESLQPLYNLLERAAVRGRARAAVRRARPRRHQLLRARDAAFSPASTAASADLGKSVRGSGVIKQVPERARASRSSALSTPSPDRSARRRRRSRLAWQIARPSITAPIASATSRAAARRARRQRRA